MFSICEGCGCFCNVLLMCLCTKKTIMFIVFKKKLCFQSFLECKIVDFWRNWPRSSNRFTPDNAGKKGHFWNPTKVAVFRSLRAHFCSTFSRSKTAKMCNFVHELETHRSLVKPVLMLHQTVTWFHQNTRKSCNFVSRK